MDENGSSSLFFSENNKKLFSLHADLESLRYDIAK